MSEESTLIVSFRGKQIKINNAMTVVEIKEQIVEQYEDLEVSDIKVLHKGKVLSSDDGALLQTAFGEKKVYKLLATGVSTKEKEYMQETMAEKQKGRTVRDDLSDVGKAEMEERKRIGRIAMAKSSRSGSQEYKFGRVQVIPNLPDQKKAREILTSLANDPGILACMAKHKWKVGMLSELYPDGKVGESAVCVMGLNKNKGQEILLRIRTDDLSGFRKILSIRKVLYHELAHNVFSEHDDDFFQLMRQIERECTELDWTNGAGLSPQEQFGTTTLYKGGSYRLGGSTTAAMLPVRELAANAALSRMTAEEEEIQAHCGCGRQANHGDTTRMDES
jgi:hypothetical protein